MIELRSAPAATYADSACTTECAIPLEDGARDVRPSVGEIEAGEDATAVRVLDRRALPRQMRKEHHAVGAARGVLGEGEQGREHGLVVTRQPEQVDRPQGCRARGRRGGSKDGRPGEDDGSGPQRGGRSGRVITRYDRVTPGEKDHGGRLEAPDRQH